MPVKEVFNSVWSDSNSHPLIGQIISLELTVVGILDVDGLVADMGCGCGVVVDHGDCCFFRSHFYKSL